MEAAPSGAGSGGSSCSCCKVNRCCCCLDLSLGVKLLALFMVLVEVVNISMVVEFKPNFVFFVVPACSIGLLCHALLLVAVFRVSRWFCVPWLIYVMLIVVSLCLASVLQVVLPLTSQDPRPDHRYWLPVLVGASATLAVAGLYMYFWIVVLELFIKMGPPVYPPPTHMAPGVVYMPAAHGGGAFMPVPASGPAVAGGPPGMVYGGQMGMTYHHHHHPGPQGQQQFYSQMPQQAFQESRPC